MQEPGEETVLSWGWGCGEGRGGWKRHPGLSGQGPGDSGLRQEGGEVLRLVGDTLGEWMGDTLEEASRRPLGYGIVHLGP